MADDKAELLKKIADEEARLSQLDEARRIVTLRLQDLRGRIATIKPEEPTATTPLTLSPDAKITLFRSLFRGREELFPKLWVDRKSGRKGYAPGMFLGMVCRPMLKSKKAADKMRKLRQPGLHPCQRQGY